MDGTVAVRTVLVADASLLAEVPAARIIEDEALPQGIALPAILIRDTSGADLPTLTPGETRFVTDRVTVEVHAKTKPDVRRVMKLVRAAAADKLYPIVPGISGVTIHTDGRGPSGISAATFVRMEVQDFMVRYTETRNP